MLDKVCRKTMLIGAVFSIATLLNSPAIAQQPQKINPMDLAKVRDMLHSAYDEVRKNYYDPKYHGIDIAARYHEVDSKLSTVGSLNEGIRMVAAYLDGFKDSHLFFIPPMRPYTLESGFRMQMIGDQCIITEVRPQTDAAEKLHPGDRVVGFNSFKVTREGIWNVEYYFNLIKPQAGNVLDIQAPDGAMRHVSVKSFIRQKVRTVDLTDLGQDYWDLVRQGQNEGHASRSILKVGGDVTYWKMPAFNLGIDEVDSAFSRVKKHGALVLDLRGNAGGSVDTLTLMLASVFDHDVKIADRVGRKDSKPMIAKHRGGGYPGKIIVLVDDRSASAAELFARTVQLEHRGTVIGDRSSGSVMEARSFDESTGGDSVVFYGFSVTDANLIMSDGKSLEGTGVTPDEVVIPTQQDIAAGRDPVLARAATLAGGSMSGVEAGKMFPVEWLPLL